MGTKADAAKRKLAQVDKLLVKLLQAQRKTEDALLAEQERERQRVG